MSAPKKYRKKPVEIEAIQFLPFNAVEVSDFMGGSPRFNSDSEGNYWMEIDTLEGTMRAERGDYIIKGIKGEFYPCKPDIFAATYDEVQP